MWWTWRCPSRTWPSPTTTSATTEPGTARDCCRYPGLYLKRVVTSLPCATCSLIPACLLLLSPLPQNLGKYRCKLSRLCLKGNQIREAGARAIKQAATLNSTLTHLDLSWNPIERQGCFDLAELLQVGGLIVLPPALSYRQMTRIDVSACRG